MPAFPQNCLEHVYIYMLIYIHINSRQIQVLNGWHRKNGERQRKGKLSPEYLGLKVVKWCEVREHASVNKSK